MKKLINTDLIGILSLIPTYLPVPTESIELDIQKLERLEETDYLFLARRERSWLFDLPRVYTSGTYENLTWTSGLELPRFPVVAMLLHVEEVAGERPKGSVVLLDYRDMAENVAIFSPLPKPQRERHIKRFLKRCAQVPYCSMMELIEFLKKGGETKWT